MSNYASVGFKVIQAYESEVAVRAREMSHLEVVLLV